MRVALLLLLGCCSAIAAAVPAASPAMPAIPAEDPIFSVQRHRLPNGLEVFIKPRTTTRAVDIRVVVKVGFRHEAVTDSGLAHLLEHMMFKGTRKHDEIALNRIIESKGAYSNGETWPDYTFYEVNIVDRHFGLAIEWLREILTESLLAERHLEQARDDVYSEQEGDYPRFIERIFKTGLFQPIFVRVPHTLFPSAELPDRIISRLEHIDERRLREFYRQHYLPNNMAVIIVGNVDPADALARVTAAFGGLQARPVQTRHFVRLPPAEIPSTEIDTDLMPPLGEMTELWRGVVTGGVRDRDRFILRVITTYLDRRIYEEIRSKRALGYSLGARTQDISDAGILYGYARVKREKDAEDESRRILRELFAELRNRPLTDAELQEAKDTILGRQARNYEGNATLASLYQEWFLNIPFGTPLPDHFDAVQRVTAADVQRVARERFGDAQMFSAVGRPTFSIIGASTVIGLLVVALLLLILRRRMKERRSAAAKGGN